RGRRGAPEPVLVGGDGRGSPPPGFDRGNSPAEYTPDRVRGRTVVFTTTNGTRALLALQGARRVAVGGFVNAAAVARWAAAEPGDVLLVCAGEKGRFCLEDAVCAGLLVSRLTGPARHPTDAARAAPPGRGRPGGVGGGWGGARRGGWRGGGGGAGALGGGGGGPPPPPAPPRAAHGVAPVPGGGGGGAAPIIFPLWGAPRHNDP